MPNQFLIELNLLEQLFNTYKNEAKKGTNIILDNITSFPPHAVLYANKIVEQYPDSRFYDIALHILSIEPSPLYYSESSEKYLRICDMSIIQRKRAALKIMHEAIGSNSIILGFISRSIESSEISLGATLVLIAPLIDRNRLFFTDKQYETIINLLSTNI